MRPRKPRSYLQNLLVGAAAVLCVGARVASEREAPQQTARFEAPRPEGRSAVARATHAFVPGLPATFTTTSYLARAAHRAAADDRPVEVVDALAALQSAVRPLSHPRALEDAFRSYFAYRASHPDARVKPYLYFVDYGLPSTEPRGYLFDMAALRVVEGPFPVAHGRGSAASRDGVPRRFSNAPGSESTSLGLYLAQELYAFRGKSAGRPYRSVGLRLAGLSGVFNSNARARGVVAHGAPYVTATKAGRSEGCPAVDPARAERLLPKLAHGGLVFLFAPDERWMAQDPWLAGDGGTYQLVANAS